MPAITDKPDSQTILPAITTSGNPTTATGGIVIRCTKCGGVLFSAHVGALKSAALLQCPACLRYRLVRPSYKIRPEPK